MFWHDLGISLFKPHFMKQIFFLLIVLGVVSGYAQDSTKVDAPVIVTKLFLGGQLEHKGISVKFVDVINDSRCPKNVNCVRAGEAKVLIAIYKDGKFVEESTIDITPTTHLLDKLPLISVNNQTTIKGFNLIPYPEFGKKIEREDYIFQMVIE